MDRLLDALQEGRLIELPVNDKEHALQYLAHIIEAVPSLPMGTDVFGLVMARERSMNTTLGRGWACPHARVPFEEELMCVVGWSPTGIDYGAPDGLPVSIVAMYLVPENQRNQYLREVSILAKALIAYPALEQLSSARELNEVREHLLNLIVSAKETIGPDTRARMIQLQTRESMPALPARDLANLVVEPVTVVTGPGVKPMILGQNRALIDALDGAAGLQDSLASQGVFQTGAWRLVKHGTTNYLGERIAYDCIAIRASGGGAMGK